ncbi:hypothetical protein [Campylobacter vicugnae]|uniref:hypothetical protein n=1 Tax=Campylobacter vicugnae TaxID=1660076 RepID=UPI000A340235|nr:hypothetical protein [Campylobacter sp. S0112]
MEKIREELIEEFNNLYKDNYYISQKEFLSKYEELKNIDLNEEEIQKIKDYFNELKNRKNKNIDLLIENIKQHEEFLALDEDERKEFIRNSVELYYSFMENQQNTQDYVAEKAELNALIPAENQGRALVAINAKLPSDVMLLTRSSMSLTPLEEEIQRQNALIESDLSKNKALIIDERNQALGDIIDAEIIDEESQINANNAKVKVVDIANNDLSKLTGKYAKFNFQKLWDYARNENEFIYPFSKQETDFDDKTFANDFIKEAMKLDTNELKKMIEIMRAKNEMLLNKKSNLDEYIKVSNELFAEVKKNQALNEADTIVNDNRTKINNTVDISKGLQEEIKMEKEVEKSENKQKFRRQK